MTTEPRPTQRRSLVRVVAVLLVLQGAAIALYGWVQRDRRPAPRVQAEHTSGAAPALAFTRADGSRGALADLHGRPVLLHFWASWCVPCREELPRLLSLARALAPDVALLAVAVEDDWESVGRFFDGTIPPDVVLVADDDGPGRFGVSTLPDSFLVSPAGDLLTRFHGPRDWDHPAMRAALERAVPNS